MNPDFFISKLTEKLTIPLPGLKVQLKMSPLGRITRLTRFLKSKHVKKSGVLILLYNDNGRLFFVLTQRPIYNGMHSGQICLPGGKFENTDIDLYNTAVRESQEEVNADASEIIKIGMLSELYVPPSKFFIQPYIGYAKIKPDFKKQASEVAEIIYVDLFAFNENPIILKKQIPTNRKISITAPYYEINGYTVWGATAMILSEFLYVVNDLMLELKHQTLLAK